MITIVWMGAAAGLVHFFIIGLLYGNPLIAKIYHEAQVSELGVKRWPDKKKYLITQTLGTQVEIYILTVGFMWLRPLIGIEGLSGAMALGLLFAAIRVYPRFWNMWIQSIYPSRLLRIEFINGTVGTLAVEAILQLLMK